MTSDPAVIAASVTATPERISELSDTLLSRIRGSIKEISEINLQAAGAIERLSGSLLYTVGSGARLLCVSSRPYRVGWDDFFWTDL